MRKYLAGIAVAASVVSVMATDARVETMGGINHFFKDDQSIYSNPATIADYDDMLIGSFGIYTEEPDEQYIEYQYNRDARKPYFGGTISFGDTEDKNSKYTIGAILNRYDPILRYLSENDKQYFIGYPKGEDSTVTFIKTDSLVGKADLIMGYTMNNGLTLGLGGYLAFQQHNVDNVEKAMTRVVKGNVGVSGPVSDNVDLEASVSIAALTLNGYTDISRNVSSADNDIAVTADVRAFAEMPKINGAFIPHIQANIIKHHTDETLLDFNGGIGFNSYIDRGFFWAGFEGIYQNDTYAYFKNFDKVDPNATDSIGKRSRIGGRVSFGIERNILTDWLVWRVGGSKLLAYEKLDEGNLSSYWVQNSEDDHVSFGMGVNIEDRFKVDAVVAENMLYTFSNLFSGNSHHFSTKISATFAF